ncbi:MAG: hypothetical protein FWB76_00035 [Oscillospiraceae bacterium]|nr:hypothetical protein [Oscillospiraceae bacterium]
MRKIIVFAAVLALALALAACNIDINLGNHDEPPVNVDFRSLYAQPLDVSTFVVPPLDLRGHNMEQSDVEQWFLQRINYHRIRYGIHPYSLYAPASVTSIEHSLDMRDNDFSGNPASDGRTHQQRHHRWFGYYRTKVTSSHSSSHTVASGALSQRGVNDIVNRIYSREVTRDFLMNPTYYYIGIGFSIDENGRGRLNITMASQEDQRAAHRARTPAQREAHRQAYLERVREERGWVAQ